MQKIWIGFSTKSYFGHEQLLAWLEVASSLSVPASVSRFVIPSLPSILLAVSFAPRGFAVGAQDVSSFPAGAQTGETPATLLKELGVELVEIGHAEQRARGLGDKEIADKVAHSQNSGLRVLLCVGEKERQDPKSAATYCLEQISASGINVANSLIAYEPIWAIGAIEPAESSHVLDTVRLIRAQLEVQPAAILYGGTAGQGLLTQLYPVVNGLFLGRRAHDPNTFNNVVLEAIELLKRD